MLRYVVRYYHCYHNTQKQHNYHMTFIWVLFLLIHEIYGSNYTVQMNDIDLNCVRESNKLSSYSIKTLSFNIWTNEISVPGILDLSLSFNVIRKLSNNIQFSTKFQRKFGPTWIALPCLAGSGACDKQSFCDLIQQACKTNSFIRSNNKDDKKPCTCDLDIGTYTIEHFPFNIKRKNSVKLAKPITTGQYRFKVTFLEAKAKTTVGCVIGYLTLLKPNKFK
jgi:hypothetical protein